MSTAEVEALDELPMPKGLPPPSALPTDISTFAAKDDKQKTKVPAQRSLCKILYHDEWCKLYQENQAADKAAQAAREEARSQGSPGSPGAGPRL